MKIKTIIALSAGVLLSVGCGTNSQTSTTQSGSESADSERRIEMGKVAGYSLDQKDSKMVLAFTGKAAEFINETLSESKTQNKNGAFDCQFVERAKTYNCSTVLTAEGELRQQKDDEEVNSIELDKVTKGDSLVLDLDESGDVLAVSILKAPALAAYKLLAHGSSTFDGDMVGGSKITKGALSCQLLSADDAVCSFDLHHSGIAAASSARD